MLISSYRRLGDISKRKEGTTFIDPPLSLVNDVLHCGEGNFPALTTLTSVPVIRTDGSVWTESGYDAGTYLYYRPETGFRLGSVPASPTKQDARVRSRLILKPPAPRNAPVSRSPITN